MYPSVLAEVARVLQQQQPAFAGLQAPAMQVLTSLLGDQAPF
jgi:hypothetical protein